MNDKEVREIRKRFRAEKNAIPKVYGCYVNEGGNIMGMFEESLSFMPQDEAERFLNILKKAISGTMGKNLLNLEFTSKQVMEDEKYALLSDLRKCELKNEELRKQLYEKIAGTLRLKGGYVILIAHDIYDVPFRNKEDRFDPENSDEQFSYSVCAICSVKEVSQALSYHAGENRVRSTFTGLTLTPPEIGFMFPLFDDRAANIYGILYHIKNSGKIHPEFIENIFGLEAPMPATEQKENFQDILSFALEDDCSLDTVHAVHEQLSELIEQHKESKEPEQLLISKQDISSVLENCGISEEHLTSFSDAFDECFGEDAELPPENIIDRRKFIINTPETMIKVDPEQSGIVDTRIINGVKYILIPAGSGIAVNGVNVRITEEKEQ